MGGDDIKFRHSTVDFHGRLIPALTEYLGENIQKRICTEAIRLLLEVSRKVFSEKTFLFQFFQATTWQLNLDLSQHELLSGPSTTRETSSVASTFFIFRERIHVKVFKRYRQVNRYLLKFKKVLKGKYLPFGI
jgi:hypothetical protein